VFNVLMGGPFTQIGIVQLGLPASVVAGLVALAPLMAVLRPWFGRLSDHQPLWGFQRSGYLRLGLGGLWLLMPMPLLGLLVLGRHWSAMDPSLRLLAAMGEALLVALPGIANQLLQTSMNALLLELTPEDQRGRAVREVMTALVMAVILVSLVSGWLLNALASLPLSARLMGLWGFWITVALPVALLGCQGLEGAGARPALPMIAPAGPGPLRFLEPRLVLFLLVVHACLFVADVLLDPYASQLHGWSLARTTQLGALWALGSLLGLAASLWSGLGQLRLLGCLATALGYGLVAAGALMPHAVPLTVLTLLLGVGAGLVQAWLADQIGRRCCGEHLGEQAGGWGAALVLTRSLGLAAAGPLFDLPHRLLGLPMAGAYAVGFGLAGLAALAGMALPLPPRPQNGASVAQSPGGSAHLRSDDQPRAQRPHQQPPAGCRQADERPPRQWSGGGG